MTFDPGQHCRIGRVRMKEGGADVRILKGGSLSALSAKLVKDARTIAQAFEPSVDGFFVIGWDKTGAFSTGAAVPYESAIPLSLLPAWIAEIARRELVTSQQVRDVLTTEYIVTPPRPSPG